MMVAIIYLHAKNTLQCLTVIFSGNHIYSYAFQRKVAHLTSVHPSKDGLQPVELNTILKICIWYDNA